MTDPEGSTSTRPPEDIGTSRGFDVGLRIFSIALMGAVVLAGLFGMFGVRSSTATASANGFSLEVTHASVTRPGLATPLTMKIATDGGSPLPETVTTRIASSYLAMFDEHGLDPQPISSFQSDGWTWWTFQVPSGASGLEVSLDARLEPSVQMGQASTAAVEIDDEQIVAVDFATRVMP